MSPIVFFFLLLRIDDDSNVMILSHTTSGMQYEESTPVTSDINTSKESVLPLSLSIKHSLLVTQLNSTFRIGS